LATVQAVGTVVSAILGLIQSVSSKSAVEQMAAHATIKMATVGPYLNEPLSGSWTVENAPNDRLVAAFIVMGVSPDG
jgi:hypothetical protein